MKKGFISLGITIASLACLFVLPLMAFEHGSYNFIEILSKSGFSSIYSNMFSLAWLLAAVCGILVIVSAVFNDRKAILITSLAASALMLASFLSSLDASIPVFFEAATNNVTLFVSEGAVLPSGSLETLPFSLGIAFWIPLVGFVANAVLAIVLEKNWNK